MAKQEKPVELKDVDLDKASGGTDGSRGKSPPPTQNVGSQSTGAGAGKVTFNPF